ncbi:carbohydrate kinase [Planococcus sp. ISL-109]|uniref:carbohydrate kinase n=1 Tax=Planococcus sp. ISL-109 TaxID=2819166 RepID=UPI001BEA9D1A|nr:carbohydrate kinase [Planococcus sp. ISL-109]MBT2584082.1 winged helix-turn-helix transcriptional regulator [Planococcus sp. ISL-109]
MTRKEQEILTLIERNPYMSQQEMADALGISRPSLANLISGLIKQGRIVGRAYVLPEEDAILCIGGANVDRKFHLKATSVPGTSNPATVTRSVGGVARNIAENIGRLGHKVQLITVAGDDPEWRFIEEASAAFMDTALTKNIAHGVTGSYTAVLEPDGEMTLALADMDIYSELTPAYLEPHRAKLMHAKLLIVDLNCPKETVRYLQDLASSARVPVAVIPVSAPKMDRLGESLTGISWLILNRDEAALRLGLSITDEADWRRSVELLLQQGAGAVVVTGGKDGAMAGNGEGIAHFKAIETQRVEDVTGAGDAFTGGLLHGCLSGYGFTQAVRLGMVNAAKTLDSAQTVRPELNETLLTNELEELI